MEAVIRYSIDNNSSSINCFAAKYLDRRSGFFQPNFGSVQPLLVEIGNQNTRKWSSAFDTFLPCGDATAVNKIATTDACAAGTAKKIDISGSSLSRSNEFLPGAPRNINIAAKVRVLLFSPWPDIFCRQAIITFD